MSLPPGRNPIAVNNNNNNNKKNIKFHPNPKICSKGAHSSEV
jgi:hypothetical protein